MTTNRWTARVGWFTALSKYIWQISNHRSKENGGQQLFGIVSMCILRLIIILLLTMATISERTFLTWYKSVSHGQSIRPFTNTLTWMKKHANSSNFIVIDLVLMMDGLMKFSLKPLSQSRPRQEISLCTLLIVFYNSGYSKMNILIETMNFVSSMYFPCLKLVSGRASTLTWNEWLQYQIKLIKTGKPLSAFILPPEWHGSFTFENVRQWMQLLLFYIGKNGYFAEHLTLPGKRFYDWSSVQLTTGSVVITLSEDYTINTGSCYQ